MYYLYIIKCADDSLYTGITTDLKRRMAEHNNSAKGAKYTSTRRPITLVYSKTCKNRSIASREEGAIKKLSRKEKLNLISNKLDHVRFQEEIRKLRNPVKAKILAGFFKTGKGQYGEGDKFLGVAVPQIRKLVKKFERLALSEIEKILHSEFHEERLGGLLVLVSQFEKAEKQDRKKIFKFYLKNIKHIDSWDLVDLTAPSIVGGFLHNEPKNILFSLAESKVLWERRIAMVATFFEIKLGKSELALSIAEQLLGDKEDLMHKAVGWMLREVGKRCSQNEEEKFLQKNLSKMPRTTLRYAIERFDEKKRQEYLRMGKA